jgi:hypothetical protein
VPKYNLKKSEMQGVVNNLLSLNRYKNPLNHFFCLREITLNLLTREVFGVAEDDDFVLFLKKKYNWFDYILLSNKLDKKDFGESIITMKGNKEEVEINYKEKLFKGFTHYDGRGRLVFIKKG